MVLRGSSAVFAIGVLLLCGLFAPGQAVAAVRTNAAPTNHPWVSSYWQVTADGTVYGPGPFGLANSFHLNEPIVGMASTPDGGGLWLVAADGGVFSFGDATFHGSEGGVHLDQPIVGMASTPDGDGYWLVAADGGVFSLGDATFHGSEGGVHLNASIVGITPTSTGAGYWLDGSDGGVFTFGDAGYFGSSPKAPGSIVGGVMPTPDQQGYWLIPVAIGQECLSFGDGECIPPASPTQPPGQSPVALPQAVAAVAVSGYQSRS